MTENEEEIHLHELSEALGFSRLVVDWVGGSIGVLNERRMAEGAEGESVHVSARDVCVALLRDIRAGYKEPVADVLARIGIASSEDIGAIVYGLVDRGLITASESDSIADFAGVFGPETLDRFLRENGIKRALVTTASLYRGVMWSLYGIGWGTVVGSYVGLVDHRVAFYGWLLGMSGFAMRFHKPRGPKRY